ncbi:MAG: ABC transporter permease subunit [Pseudonocardiaceae bacterium]|nr:ABC transporter permease subunit [Pseudonocardiaceae bacterium]
MISAGVLLLILLLALVMPVFWSYSYGDTDAGGYLPPSGDHPLGTDQIGHDMVAQLLRGTQLSLLIAFTVAVGATVIGVVLGALAGYLRGFTDALVMRFADLLLIIPQIAVAAVLIRAASGSWWVVAIIMALFFWMQIARITRGETLSLAEREFIEAARACGAGTPRVIFKHLVPNMIGSITVNATLAVAQAVLVEAALSFLGLGVQPPDTSLGVIIQENYTQLSTRPWLFFGPFVVIVLISLTINFIGDGLRDAFDPRQTKVRA